MKLLLILTSFLLFTFNGKIESALKSGNADGLGVHFANSVDLTIKEDENVYSKTQATQILKDFFKKNKVTAYTAKHNGKARDKSSFFIGELKCGAKKYRVYYLVKQNAIHQFRIEPQNE